MKEIHSRPGAALEKQRGFSLIELLAVTSIGLLLLGLAANSCLPPSHHAAVDHVAKRFCGMVREARLLAMKDGAPVRIVFVPRDLVEHAGEGEPGDWVECRLYQMVIPAAGGKEVRWREAANSQSVRGGDALERVPVAPPGLPECLVGSWKRVPVEGLRLRGVRGERVEVESPILEAWQDEPAELYAARRAWLPPTRWAPHADGLSSGGFDPASPYPPDYELVPLPDGPAFENAELPAGTRVYDPQSGTFADARELWPGKVPHFKPPETPAQKHYLPYIEVDPRGELAIRNPEEAHIVFRSPNNPVTARMVRLEQSASIARVAAALP